MITARLQHRHIQPLFTEHQWQRIAQRLELSRRELEIVRLVLEDAEEQSIAAQFGTSINTVRTQLKRLYWKLGVRSRVGLVLGIIREHLDRSKEAEPTLRLHDGSRKAA